MATPDQGVTGLLRAWGIEDSSALDRLLLIVSDELQRLAQALGPVFGISAELMRRIHVDDSRRHQAVKRGGNPIPVPLEERELAAEA